MRVECVMHFTLTPPAVQIRYLSPPKKVDMRLPGKGIQTPIAQGRSTEIISMIKWIRTSRLSMNSSVSLRVQAVVDLTARREVAAGAAAEYKEEVRSEP